MESGEEKIARQLTDVREWAQSKIAGGQEPPWAWFQYMKLVETANAILAGQNCTVTTESSPRLGPHTDAHLRLVDST